MSTASEALRVLFRVLDPRGARRVVAAAAVQFIERLGIAGGAWLVATRGQGTVIPVVVGVGAILAVRSVARARLGVYARSRILSVLVDTLLGDREDLAEAVALDTELALVDGLYASEDVLRQRLPDLLGDVPACFFLAILVTCSAPRPLVFDGVVAVAAAGAAVVALRRETARRVQRAWSSFLPALDTLLTSIHGRLEVVANGQQHRLKSSLAMVLARWRITSRDAGVVSFLAGRSPLVAAATVVGLVISRREGWTGWRDVSFGSAAMVATVVPPFVAVARGLLDLGKDLVRAAPVVERVTAFSSSSSNLDAAASKVCRAPAGVQARALSFRYSRESSLVLDTVSLRWSPGELLGLAGHNGSGKSTFVRLLLGLHTPSAGSLFSGDGPLADINVPMMHLGVAYLAQRPYLPDRVTVLDAIRLVSPDASDSGIRAVLERLGLWHVLLRHHPSAPLSVLLGTLSAGEKQRVAIARVLLRDAPMLILDEPDANLDAEGVACIGDIVHEEVKRRMVLVIAHSPQLLGRMDRVVRFERGRVVSP